MKHTNLLFLSFIVSNITLAQNPFESIGKTTKPMLSLSDGKYIEHFENDSVRQIGSAMVNIYTEQIVAFVDRKEQADKIHSQTSSRFLSIDPLAVDFPYLTPYQYAANTPIAAIDLDGLENVFVTTFKDGSEMMQTKYTKEHIEALKNGGAVPFKIYYLDAKGNTVKTTGQFEGPNKQNELKVFETMAPKLNTDVCNQLSTDAVPGGPVGHTTTGLNSPLVNVPKPSPPKPPAPKTLSAGGIAKFGNLMYPTAGTDYKGDPAGPGALGANFVSDLDNIINTVKANGSVKTIDLNLTFSYNQNTDKSAVELSAKNGLQNVKDYLQKNGLKGVNINTNYNLVDENSNGGKSVSNLDVKYK